MLKRSGIKNFPNIFSKLFWRETSILLYGVQTYLLKIIE